MTLKVPYNFVPLNEKVVTPYWIDHISHDVPFKDGKSGTLKLTLTAESPIFVRRGEAKPPKNNDERTGAQQEPYEFERDAEGNCFLPGSSLRGMVRSVLETLSFGRMIGRVSERRYALRDLSGSMKWEYLDNFKVNASVPIRGGWLRYDQDNNQYVLRDANIPGRISHRELEAKSGVRISEYFLSGGGFDQRNDKEKAGKRKYDMFDHEQNSSWYKQSKEFVHTKDDAGRKIYAVAPSTDDDLATFPGRIVMTGQPGPRKQVNDRRTGELKWTGKQYEFIFWDTNRPEDIIVPEQVVEDFKFAYFDDTPKEQSVDYKWRSQQLKNGEEIPVFWKRGVSKDSQPTVEHFGLSYLYKLPYKYTVEGSIKNNQKNAEGYDLADAILGMVGTSEQKSELDALKGRVQFTHAKLANGAQKTADERVILGEPRASFYPTYMKQSVSKSGHTGKYQTFMDGKSIAGRKRYPVLSEGTRKTREKDEKGNALSEAVFTKFLPLEKGTSFTCEIHYHNLREIELGALLSALTFHGTDQSRHQVGMAKPLGFGKVKIEVNGISSEKQAELMLRYEAFMDTELDGKNEWRSSEQVKEVIALTTPVTRTEIEVLSGEYAYNALSEFKDVKSNKEALPLHSLMRGDNLGTGLTDINSQKQQLKNEIKADKLHFEGMRPMTSNRAKKMAENAKEKIRQEFLATTQVEIDNYRKKLTQLKETAEEARRAAKWRQKQSKAADEGLDLSTVKLNRDAVKSTDTNTKKYLIKLRGKNTNKFTAEDWLLPQTDQEELKAKILEIHASGKAKRDFENAKQRAKTIEILTRYLGDEATNILFQSFK